MFGLKFGNEITALEILAKFLRSNNAKTNGESVRRGGALVRSGQNHDVRVIEISLSIFDSSILMTSQAGVFMYAGHTHLPGRVNISHIEVEKLRLLLIGSSLGETWLVQVTVRNTGLDRLGGGTVGEAL